MNGARRIGEGVSPGGSRDRPCWGKRKRKEEKRKKEGVEVEGGGRNVKWEKECKKENKERKKGRPLAVSALARVESTGGVSTTIAKGVQAKDAIRTSWEKIDYRATGWLYCVVGLPQYIAMYTWKKADSASATAAARDEKP